LVGPTISPANTVGGPQLAGTGIIVDAPPTVPAPPAVTDVSYVISDLATGAVLAAKNPHSLLPPASTLKTLTALVTLPVLDPSAVVTASHEAVTANGTRVGMLEANPYTVDQLFAGLILVSGNDTAYALAEAYGGRDKTLAAMSQRARDLGAWDTVAKDPSGLDADGQQSSAYDLSLFGRAAMALPAYRRYAVLKEFTFPGGTDRQGKVLPPFQIQNHNTLLENYPGTIGVKNGYTSGARHTFIGAVTRGDRTLLISQMGGVSVPSWQPTATLLDWAFANAGQLRPVGQLVSPGAPQPPEWRGETSSPSTSASAAAPTTTPAPARESTASPPPGSAGSTPAPNPAGGNPFPGLLASTATAVQHPATYAVLAVALAALAGWVVARRRRHRSA
jgi:D-alanyl-D-alanine carboxypeptidase (penicillin-binding protein 5/6)